MQSIPPRDPAPAAIADEVAMARALRCFATGVAVVTTHAADGAQLTAEAAGFNSVSLDPPLVLWTLERGARDVELMRTASRFIVHLATSEPHAPSMHVACGPAERDGGDGAAAMPLPACSAWFVCEVVEVHEEADHLIFIARISACGYTDQPPLVRSGGEYVAVRAHPAPGV